MPRNKSMMHGDAGIRTSQFFRFVENPKGSYRDDRWLFEGLLLKMGIYVRTLVPVFYVPGTWCNAVVLPKRLKHEPQPEFHSYSRTSQSFRVDRAEMPKAAV